MVKENKNKVHRDDTARLVADMHGVTSDYVRKVINGKRTNERILSDYITLKQGKNLLIEAVKNAVPF